MSLELITKNDILFIAEIGGNHEGSFEKAKELADLAVSSGVDAVKYQIYTGQTLVSSVEDFARVKHFDRFSLSKDQYAQLAEYVLSKGVSFSASVWAKEWIEDFSCYLDFYKIGSGDLTCYPIIEAIVKQGKPIILSTGLSYMKEVEDTVNFIFSLDEKYKEPGMLGVLQCTSMYPIPYSEANIAVMAEFEKRFPGAWIGYSDHTEGVWALELAIARGAKILEFHFTDKKHGREFRDHKVSLEPQEVKDLIRKAEIYFECLGSGNKQPTCSEVEAGHITSFRRAVYLNKSMKAGDIVHLKDLVFLRPNNGIDSREYKVLIGRALKKDVNALEKLEKDFFT